jgi:hypothetical protein
MARYTANWSAITAAAVADTTTFTAGQMPGALRAGANMQCKINEVYLGGEDTASTPTQMILARTGVLSVGALSVGGLNLMDAAALAPSVLPNWGSTAATTFPQRLATGYLLDLSLNTYGGIARWQARYGEEIGLLGVATPAQPAAEVCLSSKVGTGKTSGHIIFEVV